VCCRLWQKGYYYHPALRHEEHGGLAEARLRPTEPWPFAALPRTPHSSNPARRLQVPGADPGCGNAAEFSHPKSDPSLAVRHKVLGSRSLNISTANLLQSLVIYPKLSAAAFSLGLARRAAARACCLPYDRHVMAVSGCLLPTIPPRRVRLTRLAETSYQFVTLRFFLYAETMAMK